MNRISHRLACDQLGTTYGLRPYSLRPHTLVEQKSRQAFRQKVLTETIKASSCSIQVHMRNGNDLETIAWKSTDIEKGAGTVQVFEKSGWL
jgi:hypothetical protein